jgi:hypothetical protein
MCVYIYISASASRCGGPYIVSVFLIRRCRDCGDILSITVLQAFSLLYFVKHDCKQVLGSENRRYKVIYSHKLFFIKSLC